MENNNEETTMSRRPVVTKKTNIVLVLFYVIAAILVSMSAFKLLYNPEVTVYCYFTDNDSVSPIHKCANMKIITERPEDINMESLLNVNVTEISCSSKDDIPDCDIDDRHHLYYLYYPLDMFCVDDNCNISGNMCVKYSIEYYDNRSRYIEFYEDTFMQEKFNDSNKWNEAYDNCVRR